MLKEKFSATSHRPLDLLAMRTQFWPILDGFVCGAFTIRLSPMKLDNQNQQAR